jgi:pyruvate,water dikinase
MRARWQFVGAGQALRKSNAEKDAVQRCWALLTERALYYRRQRGLAEKASVAVLVQQLVMADVSSAVVFGADPRAGERDQVVINATWGLGESLVGGIVTPDLYVVSKAGLEIISRQVSEKTLMTVARPEGTQVAVPRCMRIEPALNDAQITELARRALSLETRQGWAVDLECAYQNNQLYLLQCPPSRPYPKVAIFCYNQAISSKGAYQ